MAIRTLTYALAATAMTFATSVQAAAAPAPVPARSGAPVGDAEQLRGGSAFLPVAIFMLAVIALMVFDDDDGPQSP
jgi:hypothetical protein